MTKYTHVDLFSGIGGFALAARWAGIKTVQFVEIDKFCQKVLNKNFKGVPVHEDIKSFSFKSDINPFLLTAGCPCQPASCAGKRRGKEDDRWLWDEAFRVLEESRPTWAIFENVAGLLSLEGGVVFDNLLTQLEGKGYEVQPFIIPACAVNAPHRRDRVWIVAYSKSIRSERRPCQVREEDGRQVGRMHSEFDGADCHAPDTKESEREQSGGTRSRREGFTNGCESFTDTESKQTHTTEQRGLHAKPCGKDSDVTHTGNQGLQRGEETGNTRINGEESRNELIGICLGWEEPWIEVATRLCRVDDGVSRGVDRVNRLKALGNAIVPQVAYQIMKSIIAVEEGCVD